MNDERHATDCNCASCSSGIERDTEHKPACDCYRCATRLAHRRLRQRGSGGPATGPMLHPMPEFRKLVVEVCQNLQTLDEYDRADRLIREYVDASNDLTVLHLGSGMLRMRDALRLINDGRGNETDPDKRRLPPYVR